MAIAKMQKDTETIEKRAERVRGTVSERRSPLAPCALSSVFSGVFSSLFASSRLLGVHPKQNMGGKVRPYYSRVGQL